MFNKLKQVVAAVAVLGMTGGAMALPAASTAFVPNTIQEFSDDFQEILFDFDASGSLTAGDVIFTALGITSFPVSGVNASTVNELTVLSAIEIAGPPNAPVGLPDGACSGGFISPTGGCALFTFKAPTIGMAGILGLAGIVLNNPSALTLTADTVGVMLEDTNHDFNQTTPFPTAADGDLRLVVDLVGANGDFWSAVGPTVLSDFLANPVGVGIGSFSLDLTVTGQSFAGWDLGPNFTGRGTLSRAPVGSFSPVGGDASFFTFAKRVPEPGSLALLGLAFAGMGLATRRRKA